MQKFVVAFYLVIFFNSITASHAAETERFLSKDLHLIAEQLNETLLFSKIVTNINPPITHLNKNVFVHTYTKLSTIEKQFCKAANVSFTTNKNVEEYARGTRLYSSALAIYLSRSMDPIGNPVEGGALSSIRLSAKQSVASS